MKTLIYFILLIFVGILAKPIWIIQPLFSLFMLAITVTIKLEKARFKKLNSKRLKRLN